MATLIEQFYKNEDRFIRKWKHYFEVYETHFAKFKGKDVNFLEIGIFRGGSLQMWKKYFGENAQIIGIDIEPNCKNFEEKNIDIHIGSQSDTVFLKSVVEKYKKFDIILDDGGHSMQQQIISFKELFFHLNEGGLYVCEDTHSSYWLRYGGGDKRPGTFIEYTKNLIDQLHAWHSEESSLRVNELTKNVFSIHYYDSIVVLEKRTVPAPVELYSGGDPSKEIVDPPEALQRRIAKAGLMSFNKFLRGLGIRSFIFGRK
jgi:hypothetical protein